MTLPPWKHTHWITMEARLTPVYNLGERRTSNSIRIPVFADVDNAGPDHLCLYTLEEWNEIRKATWTLTLNGLCYRGDPVSAHLRRL